MRPSPRVAGLAAYRVPGASDSIDLDLRGNEGSRADPSIVAPTPDELRCYPDARPLQLRLAARWDVEPERVIVTAGGDDALDRVCRAVLAPGREAILPVPGFEMTERYAHLAGATLRRVSWEESAFPLEAVLAAGSADTALVVVTTPNNPTGAVATTEQIARLSAAFPAAVILVDLAYVEYASVDPTRDVLTLPNTVVVRTFSKAWGLAGLRVGYAMGPAEVVGWMRATGAPYAVSAASIIAAERRLAQQDAVDTHVGEIRAERAAIETVLRELGARVVPSSANFVFARVRDAERIRDGLGAKGIAIRTFPDRPELDDAIRIGCPADRVGLARLLTALREIS